MSSTSPKSPAPPSAPADPVDPGRTRGGSAHRFTGALPVTLAVVLLGALVLLAWPAARHQFALSASRRPDPYVELYFADQTTARTCPTADQRTTVRATVRSHLEAAGPISYTVAIRTPDGAQYARQAGSVATTPGAATSLSARLRVPTSRYSVQVSLPGRPEQLVVHCGAHR